MMAQCADAHAIATPMSAMTHVGLSVACLDRSIQFYRDLFGMEVVSYGGFGGDQYECILGLKGAKGRASTLRAGHLRIELFEFEHPAPKPRDVTRSVADHGITHFCVEVSNIEEVYELLKAASVMFNCPPLEFFGRAKATYGRDPDGNVFELIEVLKQSGSGDGARRE